MTYYTADKHDRMSAPRNEEHSYAIEIEGRVYRVTACSQRGAELQAELAHERAIDAECGPRY